MQTKVQCERERARVALYLSVFMTAEVRRSDILLLTIKLRGVFMSFISYLINGVSLGSVYAIIALGYTMVYGIAKMLNFAHGDVIMVGGYVVFVMVSGMGLPPLLGILVSMAACTVLGITIERVAYRPLRMAASPLAVLITAIGVSYLLQNVMMLIAVLSMLQATLTLPGIAAIALTLGMAVDSNVLIHERIREELRAGRLPQLAISEGYDRAFATILDSNITSLIAGLALLIFGANTKSFTSVVTIAPIELAGGQLIISGETIVTIAACIVIMAGLTLFIRKTKAGQAMLAVSEDKGAAQLMGVNVNGTIALTFAIGSCLAALAGVLLCSTYPSLTPYTGAMPGIKAFVAAVFGGIGSIPGAMIGGILLGIIEILGKAYISSQMADAIVFAVLIVVLLVKPTGILGKKIQEKV